MRFAYFVNRGANGLTVESICKDGLGHIFEPGDGIEMADVRNGPEGNTGTCFGNARDWEKGIRYCTDDDWVWRKFSGVSGYWVGLNKTEKHDPSKLLRKDSLAGYDVILHGLTWQVPIARNCDPESGRTDLAIPKAYDLDDAGNWIVKSITPRYDTLWQAACFWFDTILSMQTSGVIDMSKCLQHAINALATNYRINAPEMLLLGTFDGPMVKSILHAVVDFQNMEVFGKKKVQAQEFNGTHGQKD